MPIPTRVHTPDPCNTVASVTRKTRERLHMPNSCLAPGFAQGPIHAPTPQSWA